jgi:FAD/FMN-containing dehydrogenase
MTDLIERTLRWLGGQLPGHVSRPGDDRYAAATAIWAKPVGPMPRAVVHCRTAEDVQSAIRAACDCHLTLSVPGGGHDWAGRALCDGLVIDLSGMRDVIIGSENRSARISGGARTSDVLAATDPLGVAAVAGAVGSVGMAGFTFGGGYGALIGRFGLALDNLLGATVVLADGRVVKANRTMKRSCSGRCVAAAEILAPEELTFQVGCVGGPDRKPVVAQMRPSRPASADILGRDGMETSHRTAMAGDDHFFAYFHLVQ